MVGVRERPIKGLDRYFDTADNRATSFTQLYDGLDLDEKGRKIPGGKDNRAVHVLEYQDTEELEAARHIHYKG